MRQKFSVWFYLLFFVSLASAGLFVVAVLTNSSQAINQVIFGRGGIKTLDDKYQLCESFALWLSFYLLAVVFTIIIMRIASAKATPASGNDTVVLNTLNRIIYNTIEQSVIFAGLFGSILFSKADHVSKIGGSRVMALASLFIIGRTLYFGGYILGAVTGMASFRSLGFVLGLATIIFMASYHLGFNLFAQLDKTVAPALKEYL